LAKILTLHTEQNTNNMSIFLGAIDQNLINRSVSYEESKKWKTEKLQKIEDSLWDYYYERARLKRYTDDKYGIYASRAFSKLRMAWNKEVEKIMKKNNVYPNYERWAYNIGDLLA
jgi:hypothetical protein